MMALAAQRAEPLLACPACAADHARPSPSAFADALLACPACGHRWVRDAAESAPAAAFYDHLHQEGLINPLPEAARRVMLDERLRFIEQLRAPGRLLDVGCGDGLFMKIAEERGWRATGLELSAAAAARAQATVRGAVICAELEDADLPAGFAVVTFFDSLEHLADPASALRRVRRLLLPTGVLAVTLPNAAGTESLCWGPRWRYLDLRAYGHLHHFTPCSLVSMLRREAAARSLKVVTYGSVDLRHVPSLGALARHRAGLFLLDRASGLLGRAAAPLHRGATLFVQARLS